MCEATQPGKQIHVFLSLTNFFWGGDRSNQTLSIGFSKDEIKNKPLEEQMWDIKKCKVLSWLQKCALLTFTLAIGLRNFDYIDETCQMTFL